MTDPAKDFRYTIGDKTVDGYQITEESRFQESLWPEWLDSRVFLTIDGATWTTITGEEVQMPDLAWIVRDATGQMSIVDALEFENYVKVVPLVAETFDDLPVVSASEPLMLPVLSPDTELLLDCKVVYKMLEIGGPDACQEALKHMTTVLSSLTNWCVCSPGACKGLDVWGCREQSPLVKSVVPDRQNTE